MRSRSSGSGRLEDREWDEDECDLFASAVLEQGSEEGDVDVRRGMEDEGEGAREDAADALLECREAKPLLPMSLWEDGVKFDAVREFEIIAELDADGEESERTCLWRVCMAESAELPAPDPGFELIPDNDIDDAEFECP